MFELCFFKEKINYIYTTDYRANFFSVNQPQPAQKVPATQARGSRALMRKRQSESDAVGHRCWRADLWFRICREAGGQGRQAVPQLAGNFPKTKACGISVTLKLQGPQSAWFPPSSLAPRPTCPPGSCFFDPLSNRTSPTTQ
ncbi:hypothetical protein M413DRAFT_158447 [Hebeloma cylindrosporum]|uniref:Uncharacterized protein n=1 Tax=Hebeloma cylindrosporum TaxID=76867 RepID=A0A0C3CBQ3_HEBCY|nr:hypothetical protein M413DRAFT_158447 [Hebeloma cylindrosporum h7]